MGFSLPFTEIDGFILQTVIQDSPNSLAVKAYQPALERPVFIKLLKPHIQDHPRWVERFTREAQVCARLRNPHIVDVYTIGKKDGYTYMALEYVEGLSLKELLEREGSLPVPVALEITRQVLLALDFVHRQQVIHRDIKPGNILIDIYAVVRVTDFGLAYLGQDASLTQAGSILGTPAYMAPEQITGEPLSPATDFFALGATLYEMLTGIKPFAGENYSACIQKILNETPDRPSRMQPDIPEAVDRIVMGMIEKMPEDRPRSAAELIRAIREVFPEKARTGAGEEIARMIGKYYVTTTAEDKTGSGRKIVSPSPAVSFSGTSPKKSYRRIFARLGLGLLILLLSVVYLWKQNSSPGLKNESGAPPSLVSEDSTPHSKKLPVESALSEVKANNQTLDETDAASKKGKQVPATEKTSDHAVLNQKTSPKNGANGSVANGRMPAEVTDGIKNALIFLNVTPWAMVAVDGVVVDSMARQKQFPLAPGKHRLVLSHPEFSPKVLEIDARAGEQHEIRYSFYQDAGFVQVEVRPWAAVYIDGKFLGNTPLKRPIPLTPGEHLIELKNPYYETVRKYIKVNRGDTLMIREILRK